MVRTIGVVDGDRRVAKLIEDALRKEGHYVRQFENPSRAYMNHEDIDMFVSEVNNFRSYRGMSGLGLTEKLNEEEREIPVMILTEKIANDVAQDTAIFAGWDAGVASYLIKPVPFNPRELCIFVQRIFESLDYVGEEVDVLDDIWEV